MLELNQCYNMDCMEGMAQFPDGFFDLAVVDPPYFSGPERRGYYGSKVSKIGVYRDYPVSPAWEIPGRAYFDELRRVSKHYIVWGCNYFNYEFAPGRIVWDKCKKGTSFSDCELAATDIFNTVRLFRFMWNGMLQGKSIAEGHIMQGNKKLNEARIIMRLIRGYSWTKISGKLGVPDSTARNWHGRAVERLGEVLEEVPMVDELAERATRART